MLEVPGGRRLRRLSGWYFRGRSGLAAESPSGRSGDPGSSLIDRVKIFFLRAAFGADPVVRQISKGCSGLNAMFEISFGRIVNIPAGAFHFLHAFFSYTKLFSERTYSVHLRRVPAHGRIYVPLWWRLPMC